MGGRDRTSLPQPGLSSHGFQQTALPGLTREQRAACRQMTYSTNPGYRRNSQRKWENQPICTKQQILCGYWETIPVVVDCNCPRCGIASVGSLGRSFPLTSELDRSTRRALHLQRPPRAMPKHLPLLTPVGNFQGNPDCLTD